MRFIVNKVRNAWDQTLVKLITSKYNCGYMTAGAQMSATSISNTGFQDHISATSALSNALSLKCFEKDFVLEGGECAVAIVGSFCKTMWLHSTNIWVNDISVNAIRAE